jgi:hypothetical protein
MESWPLQLPADTAFAPEPRDSGPGEMVRVTARGYIVRDLDDTLRRLDRNFGWEPPGAVEALADAGYRRARLTFGMPHSASLDVIQPTQWDSPTGHYLHNWGPGPYSFRIAVTGLAAKADDLRERGTDFEWVEASSEVGGRSLIRVDPEAIDGLVAEFEEYVPLGS